MWLLLVNYSLHFLCLFAKNSNFSSFFAKNEKSTDLTSIYVVTSEQYAVEVKTEGAFTFHFPVADSAMQSPWRELRGKKLKPSTTRHIIWLYVTELCFYSIISSLLLEVCLCCWLQSLISKILKTDNFERFCDKGM